jgi:hypothetical protein
MTALLRVLRKELIANRALHWATPIVVLLYGAAMYRIGGYFGTAILVVTGFQLTMMSMDHRTDAEQLLCSLPIPRSVIVIARYTSAVLLAVLVAVILAVFAPVFARLMPRALTPEGAGSSLPAALSGVLLSLVVLACVFPWVFGLGLAKGLSIGISVPVAAAAVVAGVSPRTMSSLLEWVVGARESLGGSAGAAAACAAYLASCIVSTAVFGRRDL